MSLSPGKLLGRYEIVALLGQGGMGEVYRAKDTRLNREVALKVLPAEVSGNREFKQRFEREARAISSLNHPHICSLYDVGEDEGIEYLVMEFLEGETLSQRLSRGQMPLEEVFRYGIQIAQALEKAHSQGIVHRDLKPGNIMITRSGAKLLDFGLAKLRELDANSLFGSTMSHNELTVAGSLLGTPQYMSPEQLHGGEADARSDLFALGALLFEMVTGRKAFEGRNQASLITAILTQEPPPVSAVQSVSPPELDRLIQTCLAKDPDYRWQRAQDVVNQLSSLAQGRYPSRSWSGAAKPRRRVGSWKVIAILAMLAFLTVLGLLFRSSTPPDAELIRFAVAAPAGTATTRAFAISPNGRILAFVCTDASGMDSLWIRRLDSYTDTQLKGTEDARYPFWSPDSRYVGFFAQEKLKKVDVQDGFVQSICDTTLPRGGSWNRQNVILFSKNPEDGLYKVSAAGGVPEVVTKLSSADKETTHRWPQFLPDGDHYLYYIMSGDSKKTGVYAGSLDNSGKKQLLTSDWRGVFALPGYLFFTRLGKVFAQQFDPDRLELKGEPSPFTEPIRHDVDISGFTSLSISENFMLAAWGGKDVSSRPVVFDRSGRIVKKIGEPASIFDFSLSPDQQKLALALVDPDTLTSDIWIEDLARGSRSRLTTHPQNEITPVWSPDSADIVFSSDRSGLNQLYRASVNSARKEEQLTGSEGWKYPYAWSPDGKYLLFDVTSKSQFDVWALQPAASATTFPFLQSESGELNAAFSPDSQWVAYDADESGRPEIYVEGFPPPGRKFQISVNGGSRPMWRQDGKELFFLSSSGEMMSASIQFEKGTLVAGIPRALFRFPPAALKDNTPYSVLDNGDAFLVNLLENPQSNPPLHVVVNWVESLRE